MFAGEIQHTITGPPACALAGLPAARHALGPDPRAITPSVGEGGGGAGALGSRHGNQDNRRRRWPSPPQHPPIPPRATWRGVSFRFYPMCVCSNRSDFYEQPKYTCKTWKSV